MPLGVSIDGAACSISEVTKTGRVGLGELIALLRTDAGVPSARLRRRKYMNVALLAIDEVGFEQLGRAEASLLFRLVSYRYGRGSILITTNKGIKDWPEMLAGDEVLATAILDRLLHRSHVLGLPTAAPVLAPARAPPELDFAG